MAVVATPIFNSLSHDEQTALRGRVAKEIEDAGIPLDETQRAEYLEGAAKEFKECSPYRRVVMEGADNFGGDLRSWLRR